LNSVFAASVTGAETVGCRMLREVVPEKISALGQCVTLTRMARS